MKMIIEENREMGREKKWVRNLKGRGISQQPKP